MEIKTKFSQLLHYLAESIAGPFDVRDFLLFSGLFFVAYGLWLFAPWIGYSVGGFLLMIIAVSMKN